MTTQIDYTDPQTLLDAAAEIEARLSWEMDTEDRHDIETLRADAAALIRLEHQDDTTDEA